MKTLVLEFFQQLIPNHCCLVLQNSFNHPFSAHPTSTLISFISYTPELVDTRRRFSVVLTLQRRGMSTGEYAMLSAGVAVRRSFSKEVFLRIYQISQENTCVGVCV